MSYTPKHATHSRRTKLTAWRRRHRVLFPVAVVAFLAFTSLAIAAGWFYFSSETPGAVTTASGMSAVVTGPGLSGESLAPLTVSNMPADPHDWGAYPTVQTKILNIEVPAAQAPAGVRLTFHVTGPADALAAIKAAIWLKPSFGGGGAVGVGGADTVLTGTVGKTLAQLDGMVLEIPQQIPASGQNVMSIGLKMFVPQSAPVSVANASIVTGITTELGPWNTGPGSWTWTQ